MVVAMAYSVNGDAVEQYRTAMSKLVEQLQVPRPDTARSALIGVVNAVDKGIRAAANGEGLFLHQLPEATCALMLSLVTASDRSIRCLLLSALLQDLGVTRSFSWAHWARRVDERQSLESQLQRAALAACRVPEAQKQAQSWSVVINRVRSTVSASDHPRKCSECAFGVEIVASEAAQCAQAAADALAAEIQIHDGDSDNNPEASAGVAASELLLSIIDAGQAGTANPSLLASAGVHLYRSGRNEQAVSLFERSDAAWVPVGREEASAAGTLSVSQSDRLAALWWLAEAESLGVAWRSPGDGWAASASVLQQGMPSWLLQLPASTLSSQQAPGLAELRGRGFGQALAAWGSALTRLGMHSVAPGKLFAALALLPADGASRLNAAAAALHEQQAGVAAALGIDILRRASGTDDASVPRALQALRALRDWVRFGTACLEELYGAIEERSAAGSPASAPVLGRGGPGPEITSGALHNLGVGGVTYFGSVTRAVKALTRLCGNQEVACLGAWEEAWAAAGGGSRSGHSRVAMALLAAGHAYPHTTVCSPAGEGQSATGWREWVQRRFVEHDGRRTVTKLLAQMLRARRISGVWQHWQAELALASHLIDGASKTEPVTRRMGMNFVREMEVFDALLLPLSAEQRRLIAASPKVPRSTLDLAADARAQSIPHSDCHPLAELLARPAADASLLAQHVLTLLADGSPDAITYPPFVCAADTTTINLDAWPQPPSPLHPSRPRQATLRVLYVSNDLSAHPTATLTEGLPVHHSGNGASAAPAVRVVASALHYGKHDASRVQESMVRSFRPFVPAHASTPGRLTVLGRQLLPHIAVDMQGPTRGGRELAMARRIAPLQALYLIFPGSAGRAYHDYFIADARVTPPELAAARFTERLALLPGSYQANYWPPSELKVLDSVLRGQYSVSRAVSDICDAASIAESDMSAMAKLRPWQIWRNRTLLLQHRQSKECLDARTLCVGPDGRRSVGLSGPVGQARGVEQSSLEGRVGSAVAGALGVEIALSPTEGSRSPRPFVFASFNKLEKLRPETLAAWASLMRRVPRSLLWLLAPAATNSTTVRDCNMTACLPADLEPLVHVARELAARGIARTRIVVAARGSKLSHLLRHGLADLFLDGVGGAYGAHSTATDSLRAGLPVLTVAAPFAQMPEVVAASLITAAVRSLRHLLVQPSVRSFSDTGTRIASTPMLNKVLRSSLVSSIWPSQARPHGFFNSKSFTADIERLFKAMWDARGGDGGPCARQAWGRARQQMEGQCRGAQPLFHVAVVP